MFKWIAAMVLLSASVFGQELWPVDAFQMEAFPVAITLTEVMPSNSPNTQTLAGIRCDSFFRSDSTLRIKAEEFCRQSQVNLPIAGLRKGDSLTMNFRYDFASDLSSATYSTNHWSPPVAAPQELGSFT